MHEGADEAGASSALAFIVAGAMFIAAVGVLLVTANDKVPPEGAGGDVGYRAEAQALLDLLTRSPGLGWDAATSNWTKVVDPADSTKFVHGGYRPSLVNADGSLDGGAPSGTSPYQPYAGGRLGTWAPRCPVGGVTLTQASPYNLGWPSNDVADDEPTEYADEQFTCVGYDQARQLLGLGGDLHFNFTLRLVSSSANPLPYPLDMGFGQPPPQASSPAAGAAASSQLALHDNRASLSSPQVHTYELTVYVFLQCDPDIPCDVA